MHPKKLPNNIGSSIRKYRRELDMKIETLSHAAGITKGTMSKIESQTAQTIQTSILEKIAHALGKTVADFYAPPPRKRKTEIKGTDKSNILKSKPLTFSPARQPRKPLQNQ